MSGVPRGDALALTAALVAVDSRNPSLAADGPGEAAVAERLAEVLRAWGLEVEWHDHGADRVSLVARTGRADGGRSLLLNGHLDTVGVEGMRHPPFTPTIRDGRLHGRGSADMKAGLAAMTAAAVRAHDAGATGEILLAFVADEEWESLGTRRLLAEGLRADAAIVTEPTRLAIDLEEPRARSIGQKGPGMSARHRRSSHRTACRPPAGLARHRPMVSH